MKRNLPVTGHENDFDAELRIVSTTDLKGAVRYANDDFLTIAGFDRDEVLGRNHNLVRHPDMPPAAFQDLWDTIKAGKPWMGVVKNRCKNGDHYWVDAYVTPIIEKGAVSGYQSVRLKAEREHVRAAEALYRTLWQPTPFWRGWLARLRPKLAGRVTLVAAGAALSGLLTVAAVSGLDLIALAAGFAVAAVVGAALAALLARPWQRAAMQARTLFDNAVAMQVYTGRCDELGQLQLAVKMQQSQLETVVWRIGDAAVNLEQTAGQVAGSCAVTSSSMNGQKEALEQIATAMTEMTATVREVAESASRSAEATRAADQAVSGGQQVMQETIAQIDRLAAKVAQTVEVVSRLAQDSAKIDTVVDVIRTVAEQTNLLALNAAIEAARAGEQGRGFAVVADEVRTLAKRTQASTEEIQEIVKKLQDRAQQAVVVMEEGGEAAADGVAQAAGAGEALAAITQVVGTITDMSAQIATAAEEQTMVAEDINRSITRIAQSAEETLQDSTELQNTGNSMVTEVHRLHAMVRQFGL